MRTTAGPTQVNPLERGSKLDFDPALIESAKKNIADSGKKKRGPYNTLRKRLEGRQLPGKTQNSDANLNFQSENQPNLPHAETENTKDYKPLIKRLINSSDKLISRRYESPEFITEKSEVDEISENIDESLRLLFHYLGVSVSPLIVTIVVFLLSVVPFVYIKYQMYLDVKEKFLAKVRRQAQPAAGATTGGPSADHNAINLKTV